MPASSTAWNDQDSGEELAEQRRELHSKQAPSATIATGMLARESHLNGSPFIPPDKVKGKSCHTWSVHDARALDSKKSKIANASAGVVIASWERTLALRRFQVLGMTTAGQIHAACHIRTAGNHIHADERRETANEDDKHYFMDAGNHQLFTLERTSRPSNSTQREN